MLGTQLVSHLLHPLRTTKVNGLLHLLLRHRTCLTQQATMDHNHHHPRAGSHPTTPRVDLPSRPLLQARGAAVGRLRLRLRLIRPRDTQSSSSSSSQEGSSMAGAGMAVDTGGEVAAAAAGTAGEEDGNQS